MRFQHHEQLINAILHGMLTKRCRNIRPAEICRQAKISRTTFYAHYGEVNFIEQYELKLKQNFCARLPKVKVKKEVIFRILLRFVREQFDYFEATMPNANFWLLKMIFIDLYPTLKSKDGNLKSYDLYMSRQIMLIFYWVQYDKCAIEKLRTYVHKMTIEPMMHWEI